LEGKRIQGKVKQRTIANLGRLDLIKQTGMADLLIGKLKDYAKISKLMDMDRASCGWSKEYGIVVVLRKLWEITGLGGMFKNHLKSYKYRSNIAECILSLIVSRLLSAGGEYHSAQRLKSVYEPRRNTLQLQQFYRALDFYRNSLAVTNFSS
jgi:hypothetical protein